MMTLPLTLGISGLTAAVLTVLFLGICLLLVLIVLVQRPQGGGLSGAFGAGGGGSSGQSAFGAKTGDALTIATVGIFVMFLAGAVALNFALRPTEAQQAEAELAAAETESGAGGESDDTAPEVVIPSDDADDESTGDDDSQADTEPPADDEAPETADPEPGESTDGEG